MKRNQQKTDMDYRRQAVGQSKRLVVKVGTRLLTDLERIPLLVDQLARLKQRDYHLLLVSSGAVGIGMQMMGLEKRPARLSDVQALASIGQAKLMSIYEKAAVKNGFHVGQLLLTATGLKDRERHLNTLNCINALWNQNVLPIVNENDAVSVDELKFGDNDILAALVSSMTRAELTVLLTTVDGLHEVDEKGKRRGRISTVPQITERLISYASGTDNQSLSIGGMISKLRAAEIVTAAGDWLWIADGRDPEVLTRIVAGEDIGTLFLPVRSKQMQSKKRWIKFFSRKAGTIVLDRGAVDALVNEGRSLLPSGITGVKGEFHRGDTVELTDGKGAVIAKGLTNYNAAEIRQLSGRQSKDIASILGYIADEVVVHRNNLVVIRTSGGVELRES